jgi:hypothetical protein
MGKVDQAITMYGHNPVAPILAGVLTFVGGSFFRYFEQRGHLEAARYAAHKDGDEHKSNATLELRGPPPKYSFAGWNGGLSRALWFTCTYLYLGKLRNGGRDAETVKLALTAIYVFIDMLEEVLPKYNPLDFPERIIASVIRGINSALRLGPPCTPNNRLLQ